MFQGFVKSTRAIERQLVESHRGRQLNREMREGTEAQMRLLAAKVTPHVPGSGVPLRSDFRGVTQQVQETSLK